VNMYGFVDNNPVSGIDLLGMWHGAVMVITSPFDPEWSIYASDFVALGLNKTASALEKFNATSSKTTRKCRLSVAKQGLKEFGNSVVERQIRAPTSLGGTVDPNIIDDVFLWTKHDGGKPIGVDFGWLSRLEQPNGKLFWAGSYTEEYKQNYMKNRMPSIYPKEDIRDWIVTQGKGRRLTPDSARWLLEQIRNRFNDANCTYCKVENGKKKKYTLKFEIDWQPIDKNEIASKYGAETTYPKTPNYPVLKITQQ
jgi:hypothetical protein